MYIRDVMELTVSYDTKIIAGSKGMNRTVHSIEVLEVPHVEQWLTPGKLLVTTFYTLKDDISAQKKLIEKLIINEASGLMIKFGRFINSLPKEILLFAEEKNFPIISIPKEISYENLLSPLYKQLYISGNVNLIERLENFSFTNLVALLNEVYSSFGLVTYVENLQGALIFCGNYNIKDMWRQSDELFSLPSYRTANEIINKINLSYNKYIKHNFLKLNQLNRIIIPLYSKGSKYALLHIVYKREKQKELVLNPIVFRIVDKIHVSIMGEIINMQKNNLFNESDYQNWSKDNSFKVLLNFNFPFLISHDTMFDAGLLLKEEIGKMLKSVEEIYGFYVFFNNNDTYAVISMPNYEVSSDFISHSLFKALRNTKIYNSYISMSRAFKIIDNYDKNMEITKKMNNIGRKMYPHTHVFTFEKLGIHTILMDLSNDYYVMDYVNDVLKDIKKLDDELIKTLKVFLFNNQNISETGKILFLNRKTVTNRLNKIKKQTNLDLNNTEDIFILQFCIKLEDLKLNFPL